MFRLSLVLLAVLTAGGAVIDARVTRQSRRSWQRVVPEVADATLEGSLPALLRARLLATRALVALPRSGDLLVDSAFLEALMAYDYGLPCVRAAESALARATSTAAAPAAAPAAVLATRALLALVRGDPALGLELSRNAAEAERVDGRPLLVLGRAHLAVGDLRAAAAVFEAAMVRAPGAAGPLVGWAEAQLGLGSRQGPGSALAEALRRAPQHTRALLLSEQVSQLRIGAGAAEAAEKRAGACLRDGRLSPILAASCELGRATAARLRGDRGAALADVRASLARMGRTTGRVQPQDVALAAILLTHLGEGEAAEQAMARTRGVLPPAHPWVGWAQVTLAGSRAEPPPRTLPAYPQHAEARLAAAREALAEGGPEGLTAFLDELDPPSVAADPDLRTLARLRVRSPLPARGAATLPADGPAEVVEEPPTDGASDPRFAFVEGLRARQAGDAPRAARWLARALDHHADACRAVGHYLPLLALQGQLPGEELEPLRKRNPRCQELRWTEPSAAADAVGVASPADAPPATPSP
jgi:hypothetical protein